MSRSGRRGWRTTQPDPAAVGPMLREFGFIGCEVDPIRIRASWDDEGRPRRIHAHYAGGWTCTMNMAADGSYTMSQALRLRITTRKALA